MPIDILDEIGANNSPADCWVTTDRDVPMAHIFGCQDRYGADPKIASPKIRSNRVKSIQCVWTQK